MTHVVNEPAIRKPCSDYTKRGITPVRNDASQPTTQVHEPGVQFALAAGSMRSIVVRTGASVVCDRGTLWLTADHSTDDIVLGAGDMYQAAQSGQVTLVALSEGAYRLSNAIPSSAKGRKPANRVQSMRQFLRSSRLRLAAPAVR